MQRSEIFLHLAYLKEGRTGVLYTMLLCSAGRPKAKNTRCDVSRNLGSLQSGPKTGPRHLHKRVPQIHIIIALRSASHLPSILSGARERKVVYQDQSPLLFLSAFLTTALSRKMSVKVHGSLLFGRSSTIIVSIKNASLWLGPKILPLLADVTYGVLDPYSCELLSPHTPESSSVPLIHSAAC